MTDHKKISFAAWDGMFTDKQLREIINMSLTAANAGVLLHDVLRQKLAEPKKTHEKEPGFIKKPIRTCPKCGGVLKLFSVHTKESVVYKSKWECCKTCSKEPCGYVEYVEKDIEEYIKEYKGI